MESSSPTYPSDLSSLLIEQIRNSGPIRFDQFMQTALYDPDYGYYCRDFQNRVGKQGDFFTSVSVGPLLGTLIAFQSWDWQRKSESQQVPNHPQPACSRPFHLLECGAHDGVLASDVLNAARVHTHTKDSEPWPWLQYWILEPVSERQRWQREKIRSQAGESNLENVRWISSWEEARHLNPVGWDLIFANELLDAFPIRRFCWNRKRQVWHEMAVGLNLEETAMEWTLLPDSASAELPECAHSKWLRENDCLSELPDQFIVEWSPAAEEWWAAAATFLSPGGRLWTLDYGHETDRFWDPTRAHGTLRGYKKHQLVESVLENPGEQDLTAAVHFTAIRQRGESAGLVTETHPYETQARNLTEIFKKLWILKESLTDQPAASWANFTWNTQMNRQFQTLTHPEQLGSVFRALIQRKMDL